GRLAPGAYAINDGRGTEDCAGHGTHVAGLAAGATYGVAKAATIVPVRVLNCAGNGSEAGVLASIDWVIDQHVSGPAVANLSIGGGSNPLIDDAVTALVDDGIAVALAAGNAGQNACFTSPARAAAPLTVGASTITDGRALFSNYGPCLDLFAPGEDIRSAWIGSPTAANTISGTSMASPHVAGALAVLWADNPSLSAVQVQQLLLSEATPNKLTDTGPGSPNSLLHLAGPGGGGGGGTTTTTTTPTPPPPETVTLLLAGPAGALQPAQRCSTDPSC
ncbi:MAG: S8 family peptidase, partial [Ilumatobacteraceae bacterium]